MRSKLSIVFLVLSLAVNAGVLASVGHHYYFRSGTAPTEPCPISPGDSHLYQSLGLSDLQLSKMEPLAKSFHDRLDELGAAMEGRKGLLIDLLQKDSDPVTIEKLRNEMADIQDEIQNEVIVHITETKRILDPQQQQRLFDLMRQSMVRKSSVLSHGGN
jgi:Spy/CpxP family protein refolding chaperone